MLLPLKFLGRNLSVANFRTEVYPSKLNDGSGESQAVNSADTCSFEDFCDFVQGASCCHHIVNYDHNAPFHKFGFDDLKSALDIFPPFPRAQSRLRARRSDLCEQVGFNRDVKVSPHHFSEQGCLVVAAVPLSFGVKRDRDEKIRVQPRGRQRHALPFKGVLKQFSHKFPHRLRQARFPLELESVDRFTGDAFIDDCGTGVIKLVSPLKAHATKRGCLSERVKRPAAPEAIRWSNFHPLALTLLTN